VIEVMVVDDDFMVARIHTGFVERTPGFTVTGVAHTGAQALVEAERLQPDLVLLDVYLPDVSGLDLLGALREAAPEVDVLVISAAREAETVRRALRGGIVHYLMKPFSYDDLRARLEHYQQAYAGLASAEADQADVDRVFGVRGSEKRLPKGFSPETLRLVEDAQYRPHRCILTRLPASGRLVLRFAGVPRASRLVAYGGFAYFLERDAVTPQVALTVNDERRSLGSRRFAGADGWARLDAGGTEGGAVEVTVERVASSQSDFCFSLEAR
jgi:response regulator of citrate/malate metabolism